MPATIAASSALASVGGARRPDTVDGDEGAPPEPGDGIGGEHDVMVIGRHAVRDAVLERIETLGCCGRI